MHAAFVYSSPVLRREKVFLIAGKLGESRESFLRYIDGNRTQLTNSLQSQAITVSETLEMKG